MTSKDLFLRDGGFWHLDFEGFVKKNAGQDFLILRTLGDVVVEDLVTIDSVTLGEIILPKWLPSIKPAFQQLSELAEKRRKRSIEWVKEVAGEAANQIGANDNNHGDLYITKSGSLIQIFDASATYIWQGTSGEWGNGFTSFLAGNQPLFLGNGFDFIHQDKE
jgi:hypothetical protein